MTEANQNQDQNLEQQNLNQNLPENLEGNDQGVVLTSEQYNALLDHVATLETKLMESPVGAREVRKLDDLVDEAQNAPQKVVQPKGPQKPLEDMTPQEVLGILYNNIAQNLIQPLETKIETLRIINEIDKVAGKPGNEDFWDYAPRVRELAIRNPTLSIQQAYRLAKTEESGKPEGKGDAGLTKKSDVLYTLPKRPNIVGGEKPGASGSNLKGTAPLSRRDAASEAFDRATSGKK